MVSGTLVGSLPNRTHDNEWYEISINHRGKEIKLVTTRDVPLSIQNIEAYTTADNCIDKSMTILAAEGRLYNFGKPDSEATATPAASTTTTTCTSSDSMLDDWPDALFCGEGNFKGNLYYLQSRLSTSTTYVFQIGEKQASIEYNPDKDQEYNNVDNIMKERKANKTDADDGIDDPNFTDEEEM